MNKILLGILLCFSFTACDYYVINAHENHVGVIGEKEGISNDDFSVCFEEKIFPYYYGNNVAKYKSGKDSLRLYFDQNFDNKDYTGQSGYITIRFIINCKGETGRFEILQTGTDFKTKEFEPILVDQLFNLVQNLERWQAIKFQGDSFDSFFHLTFKIENGQIVEILP